MYNKIILIGSLVDHPQDSYDPDRNKCLCIQIKVPPPPDAPPTYWGTVYDLRGPDRATGDDIFLVTCRDYLLVERCLQTLRKGDVVCVEGRLVLTQLHSEGEFLPLAEILANDVILLTEDVRVQLQEE
jgi:single-stranded DNA-binding protein